jgi:hypothetical protein
LAIQAEEKRFSLVRRYDPTTEGLYHGWLAAWRRRLWNERGFRTSLGGEELSRVRDALATFHRIRDRLPPDRRDIGQYRTVEDLRSAIPTRVAEGRRREEAAALKATAHSQSSFRFRDGAWALIELRGFAAARFWGLGTRWCTTSSEEVYLKYARISPLLVLLTPHGRYQLQIGGQFRDAEDRDAGNDALAGAPTHLRALMRHCG